MFFLKNNYNDFKIERVLYENNEDFIECLSEIENDLSQYSGFILIIKNYIFINKKNKNQYNKQYHQKSNNFNKS